jgi:hypothetical protein
LYPKKARFFGSPGDVQFLGRSCHNQTGKPYVHGMMPGTAAETDAIAAARGPRERIF